MLLMTSIVASCGLLWSEIRRTGIQKSRAICRSGKKFCTLECNILSIIITYTHNNVCQSTSNHQKAPDGSKSEASPEMWVLSPHHSMYNFLSQEKFSFLYSVNELFSWNFANIFCLSISWHISFTNLNISFQLRSCCFLHTNANPIHDDTRRYRSVNVFYIHTH